MKIKSVGTFSGNIPSIMKSLSLRRIVDGSDRQRIQAQTVFVVGWYYFVGDRVYA